MIAGRDVARARARRTCARAPTGRACRTYFAKANDVCVTAAAEASQAGAQAATSGGGGQAVVAGIQSAMSQTVAQFAALTPPAAQKAGHARALALLRADAQLRNLVARTRSAGDPAAALDRAVRRDERTRASRRDRATMTRLGYAACAA